MNYETLLFAISKKKRLIFLHCCRHQVAALAISTGNGLLLKGGREALHTNTLLTKLVGDALETYVDRETVGLVSAMKPFIIKAPAKKDHPQSNERSLLSLKTSLAEPLWWF